MGLLIRRRTNHLTVVYGGKRKQNHMGLWKGGEGGEDVKTNGTLEGQTTRVCGVKKKNNIRLLKGKEKEHTRNNEVTETNHKKQTRANCYFKNVWISSYEDR
jgi:hypothetical protein